MDKTQIAKDIRDAIKGGQLDTLRSLLEKDPEMLTWMTPFGTWLHVATAQGHLKIVEYLISVGIDIHAQGGTFSTNALERAATKGHLDIAEYLINYNIEIDTSEPERNPLFGAIINGHVDIAKLLIESGIDVNVKYAGESMKAMDALAFAKEQGQGEIVKLLENQKGCSTTSIETNDNNQNHHHIILEYVTKHFGPIKNTISEIVPGSRVVVNIHIIPPSVNKDFVTLVTTGMSDEPMGYSNEEGVFKYAELLLKLPSSWIIEKGSMEDQDHYWPLGWLRKVAHIPHIYDGWLEEGVILPNGEPPQPFASSTKLSCIMVCRSQEPELDNVYTKQGNINIYTLVPIYEEERNLALEKGHDYLLKRMREEGISDVLDIDRVNVGIW
ncbi:suppressor of fused domain protein [Bacillus sp. FJAT-51639]|uniref:Suppressor of fused domain protein n=1 Tax=Bacillus bruguierae TaxID=3127667 RepID=A0ABU8FMU4_9BACI